MDRFWQVSRWRNSPNSRTEPDSYADYNQYGYTYIDQNTIPKYDTHTNQNTSTNLDQNTYSNEDIDQDTLLIANTN